MSETQLCAQRAHTLEEGQVGRGECTRGYERNATGRTVFTSGQCQSLGKGAEEQGSQAHSAAGRYGRTARGPGVQGSTVDRLDQRGWQEPD